jgi:methylthioribose-1-phosphate isomerase
MLVNKKSYRTIWSSLDADKQYTVSIIDQTLLPHQFKVAVISNLAEMVHAIQSMQVRGAPLIGAAAAYGIALAMLDGQTDAHLDQAVMQLQASRPTAVNLAWALKRMQARLAPMQEADRLKAAWNEASAICEEDVVLNRQIAQHGLAVIESQLKSLSELEGKPRNVINILTHCNAGWLATVDGGTALGPIYAAHDAGINVHVWVDETRPRNQGASLTAWELGQHGVPYTVICDNAGGHLMQHGGVDMVIVGADRVTRTGDVCNKIGTYLKALAAFDNDVPFYVAVPSPTIDWALDDGVNEIPIELRDANEVDWVQGITVEGDLQSVKVTPDGARSANPAFDVTPARLVTGFITELGFHAPSKLEFILNKRNIK